MPKFLDSHPLKGAKPETLKKLQKEPKDEFGADTRVDDAQFPDSFTGTGSVPLVDSGTYTVEVRESHVGSAIFPGLTFDVFL